MPDISAQGEEYLHTTGGHSKFWQVILAGSTVATRYGKIGGPSQITVHHHPSTGAARDQFQRLTDEKVRKGYRENRNARVSFLIPEVLTTAAQSTALNTGRGGHLPAAAQALSAYYLETVIRTGHALQSNDPIYRALATGTINARHAALGAFAGYQITDPVLTTMDSETLAVMGGLLTLGSGTTIDDL